VYWLLLLWIPYKTQSRELILGIQRLGGEERRLKHLVPAPAVRLMKSRVLSRPGVNSLVHKNSISGLALGNELLRQRQTGGHMKYRQIMKEMSSGSLFMNRCRYRCQDQEYHTGIHPSLGSVVVPILK